VQWSIFVAYDYLRLERKKKRAFSTVSAWKTNCGQFLSTTVRRRAYMGSGAWADLNKAWCGKWHIIIILISLLYIFTHILIQTPNFLCLYMHLYFYSYINMGIFFLIYTHVYIFTHIRETFFFNLYMCLFLTYILIRGPFF